MNRQQYHDALSLCYRMETAGAIAGEVAMLLRSDPVERDKLDTFRRLEASTKILCSRALQRENVAPPVVEPKLYRNAFTLGMRLGAAEWDDFLDRLEATLHPEVFSNYLLDASGTEIDHEYEGVDIELLRHLLAHEVAQQSFLDHERSGSGGASANAMQQLLDSAICQGLIGRSDPVGW